MRGENPIIHITMPKGTFLNAVTGLGWDTLVAVVYFDQRLGAEHTKCWSK